MAESLFAAGAAGISTTPTPPSQDLRNERAKLESSNEGSQAPFQTSDRWSTSVATRDSLSELYDRGHSCHVSNITFFIFGLFFLNRINLF